MQKKNELTTYEKQSRERILHLISEYCEGSQQRFSERTGLNKASVSQYVNGKNTPSNITAAKIAQVFGVDPAWVNGFDVPMSPAATSEPAAVVQCADIVLTELEREIIVRFRKADEFDQETVLRTLHIKRDELYHSLGGVG